MAAGAAATIANASAHAPSGPLIRLKIDIPLSPFVVPRVVRRAFCLVAVEVRGGRKISRRGRL
jgi:hypothetical protein